MAAPWPRSRIRKTDRPDHSNDDAREGSARRRPFLRRGRWLLERRIREPRPRRTDLPSGARVLEIGCGAGMLSVALAHRGFDVTATDSSAEMLQAAAEAAARDRVHIGLVRADALVLPVPAQTFDLVAAVGVLPWVSSPQRALAEIARVLKPGGAAVVTSDNLGRLNV
ncbi:MAG: class I SAM-dependent methyltransferase, partial [Actinomycetota bacterium]|nr:class I SAM-dependent methyltransferase [Actinomycetota bacterium]